MATQTINGITLFSPNDPCLVFNPCLFRLTGTMSRTRVNITSGGRHYETTYQTPSGGYLDLRQYLQTFFDGSNFGQDFELMGDLQASDLGKQVTITLEALDSDGTVIATFNKFIYCVWGGVAVGERYNEATRHLTWFRNYPFTVGLYASAAKTVEYSSYIVSPQDGGLVRHVVLPSAGLYNVNINDDGDVTQRFITLIDAASPYKEHAIIRIDREHDEGVYLRWVNRHGMWDYHLFKAGDDTRNAASRFGMLYRNNLAKFYQEDGWQGDAGRRQSFTRNDVLPLCAPLVDDETFERLQDITTSPVIDMFLGYDQHDEPTWTAVTVEAGSYTKDVKKPEQDFIFNLLLPEIPVQTL